SRRARGPPSRWRSATGAEGRVSRGRSGFSRGPCAALLSSPLLNPSVIAGKQDLRHVPAAKLGRPGVVGILEPTLELCGEALLQARLLASERARQASCDGVQEHHRGQLAAGEDVGPDRHGVCREIFGDALVEALEASREERHVLLCGELFAKLLVELTALR